MSGYVIYQVIIHKVKYMNLMVIGEVKHIKCMEKHFR